MLLLFSCSVASSSLWPHGRQHARLPCPSLSPRACSSSCPLSQWCHPTISSSALFSSCLQSLPASGSFPVNWLIESGGQSIRNSASASVLPMNIQDWFLLGLTGLISLLSQGLSRVFSSTTGQKHQFFGAQLSLWANSHIHTWLLEKPSVSSVQFSCSVMSFSLPSHGLQHVRPPCPTPGVYLNSCPSSRWCYPTISSSFVPFSSHLHYLPASGSFPVSQFFVSGGQTIGVSSSASVLPMNIQDWFPLGLTGLILQSKRLSRIFSNTTVQKHQFFSAQSSLWSNSHIHTWL